MIEATAAPPIVPATPMNDPRIAAVAAARAPETIWGIDRPEDLLTLESSPGVAPPPAVLVEVCVMAPRARVTSGSWGPDPDSRRRARSGGSVCPDAPQGASVASR